MTCGQCLNQIFAVFVISEIIRSDNGPQFTSLEYKCFVRNWSVLSVISSPYYDQTNVEAVKAVQTVNDLLTRSVEVSEAVLAI